LVTRHFWNVIEGSMAEAVTRSAPPFDPAELPSISVPSRSSIVPPKL